MNAMILLKSHYEKIKYDNIIKNQCNICGDIDVECIKSLQSGTFMDWQYLVNKNHYTCVSCASVVQGLDNKIRKSSWITNDKQLIFLKKQDIIEYIKTPIDSPFSFYITTSYKKNGYLK